MHRANSAHLERTLGRIGQAARALGISEATRWAVVPGSATYGRAWRLMAVDPEHGGHGSVIGSDGYLGMTKTEANHKLEGIAEGLELALAAQSRASIAAAAAAQHLPRTAPTTT